MVDSQDVKVHGLVGKIFFPNSSERRPAVIVFSGSDGGIPASKAELFAKEGYVALALAYFNVDGLPGKLENIPLEYILYGIRWLKAQPRVQPEKIHLLGRSKGGELVLVVASTFPNEIASIIAIVPSCVTFGGIPNAQVPSWTFLGKPLPIAPTPSKEDVYKQLETRETVNLAQLYLDKMQDKESFNKALIQVENIRCPVLLVSGKEDKMWPSSLYCELIIKRLDKFRSSIFRKHLCYDNAGHMITSPYDPIETEPFKHPISGLFYELGGDPVAQAAACKDSWGKILLFLSDTSNVENQMKRDYLC